MLKPFASKNRTSQHVLLLGGTGSIGEAVAQTLAKRGHFVTCLARSKQSEEKLKKQNFDVIPGDIRAPSRWLTAVADFDAVIHCAITWSDDMAQVDHRLSSAIMKMLSAQAVKKTFIYTGGCWAYGDTAGKVADETTPYAPIDEFAVSLEIEQKVLANTLIRGIVIHPAMVYEREGGVLEHMYEDIKKRQKIRIIGSKKTHWTMVHRSDLAMLYCLALEKSEGATKYNASAIESVRVESIANVLSTRFKLTEKPEVLAVDKAVLEFGSWAVGFGLNQKMSSPKARDQLGWKPVHTDILSEIA